ncbi:olfactory receptor 5V1-like [Spea bombifrons]|uniref:olfactory receptor 5V1-like n=1 Tax=Spea bombifrons TaxID=233779 RepID=UPI00234A3167|nr:olfactory receptor 5V1-like [Spea bombifrons]
MGFLTSRSGTFVLFAMVLLVYLVAIAGNVLILTLVYMNPQLHTSMYFFLSILSTLDIFYISSTLPKLLYISWTGDHKVSYESCMLQLYFFLFFADTESFLLTSMAFDRYVAVCIPLRYSLLMNKKVCCLLGFMAWLMGSTNALILTWLVTRLSFCGLSYINNFFCDLKALLVTSCSDTSFLKSFITVDGIFIGGVPLLLTLSSYISIILSIVKIKSSAGRMKSFSNCTSHIIVVTLYYGSALILYMQYSQEQDKLLSVLFVTLVPVLNPLVYSLRNKAILGGMKRLSVF